jgi:hypothetical protein
MKLALEIIKREISQRELANKHNHLMKDETTKELESLQKVVNFISSNPVLSEEFTHQLGIGAVISWVSCSEKLPSVEQNGRKVLIYRIMNDSQASLSISIHDTSMVKHCNVNETWWMELPKPPCI